MMSPVLRVKSRVLRVMSLALHVTSPVLRVMSLALHVTSPVLRVGLRRDPSDPHHRVRRTRCQKPEP
ncbi:MAG: hypothetical protein ACK57G_12620 [Planctomycetota bacterium]